MSVSYSKFISKDTVLIIDKKNKSEVLGVLIDKAASISGLERETVAKMTWRREKMMTTGVGLGLALPHIRVNDIPAPIVLVGVCKHPIADYETQDERPVQLIVFIVAPDQDQEAYLELLGSVSKKLRNHDVVDEILKNITRPSQILRILKRREPKV